MEEHIHYSHLNILATFGYGWVSEVEAQFALPTPPHWAVQNYFVRLSSLHVCRYVHI